MLKILLVFHLLRSDFANRGVLQINCSAAVRKLELEMMPRLNNLEKHLSIRFFHMTFSRIIFAVCIKVLLRKPGISVLIRDFNSSEH